MATDDSRLTRAERYWTPAPADHVAASVVGRHAEPIAVGPWQRFIIGGIVHIAGGRDWVFDAADPAADAALLRSGRHGGARSCQGRGSHESSESFRHQVSPSVGSIFV